MASLPRLRTAAEASTVSSEGAEGSFGAAAAAGGINEAGKEQPAVGCPEVEAGAAAKLIPPLLPMAENENGTDAAKPVEGTAVPPMSTFAAAAEGVIDEKEKG